MSERITSELRRAMRIGHAVDEGEQVDAIRHGAFMDLCAAIDAVHANLERENESLRRELDRVLGEEHDFAPESHYMMLPKDADGEPIHIGDRLTDGEYTFEVCELAAFCDGSWSIRNEDGNAWAACDVTHHEPDSWERIIADAAATRCDFDDLVARCRALSNNG